MPSGCPVPGSHQCIICHYRTLGPRRHSGISRRSRPGASDIPLRPGFALFKSTVSAPLSRAVEQVPEPYLSPLCGPTNTVLVTQNHNVACPR